MTASKPSRAVTRKRCELAGCEAKFTATRKDARYCSPACRQAALRARAGQDDLARQIDEARALYWRLVQQYAEARGMSMCAANSEISPTVTEGGEVWIKGRLAGWCKPQRPGWSAWGLEAAPPPFLPPTGWADKEYGRAAVDAEVRRRRRRPVSRVVTDAACPPAASGEDEAAARDLLADMLAVGFDAAKVTARFPDWAEGR